MESWNVNSHSEIVRNRSSSLSIRTVDGPRKENEADDAATTAMRDMFDSVNMAGTVVIGEGELDEAPMLYIGEELEQVTLIH